MFDVGGGELVLIFIAVLLLFGPKKIPEVMRSVGKGLRQFRQAQDDLKEQLRDISSEVERSADVRTVQPTVHDTRQALEPDTPQIEPAVTENAESDIHSEPAADYTPPVPRQKRMPDDENIDNVS
ncbi:TatA/E family twin arginine-targeting protein translocase [Ignavibacteria bacterium]|nr:twin-arginine translocase TatA/TatE family subunit [Bacteroidota bacterium]MCZ2131632.1 twin-arginine translocase TatA/TatE family subunit [Bacteroidota bacterium]